MPKSDPGRRDGAILYAAQRLGETDGKVSPNQVLRELRSQGRGYRKQDFLKDFSGLTGKPQTVKPGAIKGGLLSGVMRRKSVKAMPKDQQQAVKGITGRAIDATAETGDRPTKKMVIITIPGKTLVRFEQAADIEDTEELEDEEEVADNVNIGELDKENVQEVFSIMDHIYDRLT